MKRGKKCKRKSRCRACGHLFLTTDGFVGAMADGEKDWCCRYCWAIGPTAVRGLLGWPQHLGLALRNALEIIVDEVRKGRRR